MRVVVYGSRPDGHARVVAELLVPGSGHELVGLVDDYAEHSAREVAGVKVLGTGAALPALAADGVEGVLLGFGAVEGRADVLEAVAAAGLALPALVHPSAHVAPSAELGAGVQLLPQVSVGPAARLGRGVLVNTAAVLEHDVQAADCAVIGPGAILAGRARVGAGAAVGAGAVVLPDVHLGAGCVIGAGAVVTRDVAAGATVAGVPARDLG